MEYSSIFVEAIISTFIMLLHSNSIVIFILFIISLKILSLVLETRKRNKIDKQINDLANNSMELSPKEFFTLRNKKVFNEKSRYSNTKNFPGVYILHNKNKNLFYVGQSIKVLDRIGSHFTGNGNGDVYADYKYGDTFSIRTISLDTSGFESLHDLERYAIRTFNAFGKGYNKNRGNTAKFTCK